MSNGNNRFKAKVRTPRGQLKELELHAGDAAAARRIAEKQGTVLSLTRANTWWPASPLSPTDRAIFFSRLAAMLASNMGASEALALIRDTFTGKISRAAGRLHTNIEAGDDIAQAIAREGAPNYPDNVVALISAGSKGGNTAQALRDANAFESGMQEVKKTSGKGLWSGIGGLLFAGITVVGTDMYAGPMMESSGMTAMAPGAIDNAWVFTLSTVSTWIIGFILTGLIVLGLLGTVGRRFAPVKADKLVLRIPYYKDIVLARNNFVVLYGLALLIRSGVRLEEALRLSAEGAPKGALKRDLENATHEVRQGRPWPTAMSTLHPTDRAALMSSQDREQVSRTFDALAIQYRDLYGARMGALVPLLQMVAALFLTLSGVILFGASILPMLQLSQGLLSQ